MNKRKRIALTFLTGLVSHYWTLCAGYDILLLWPVFTTEIPWRPTMEFVDVAFPWYMRRWNLERMMIAWKGHCGLWILVCSVSKSPARGIQHKRWNGFKVKYAMSGESSVFCLYESRSKSCLEPTLAPGLLKSLFGCQANEKVSLPLNKVSS